MMKTRSTGIVLCFNFTDEKYEKIENIARKQGVRIKRPERGDFEKSVGELAGFQNITPIDGQIDFDDELMVIQGLLGGDFDKFLKTLRANEIIVPYKAMLTETNKSWTPAELAKQIKLEHEQMKR